MTQFELNLVKYKITEKYTQKCLKLFQELNQTQQILANHKIINGFNFIIKSEDISIFTSKFTRHIRINFAIDDHSNFLCYYQFVHKADPENEGDYYEYTLDSGFKKIETGLAKLNIKRYKDVILPHLKTLSGNRNTEKILVNADDLKKYFIDSNNETPILEFQLTQVSKVEDKDGIDELKEKINNELVNHITLFIFPWDKNAQRIIVRHGNHNIVSYDFNNLCPPDCNF